MERDDDLRGRFQSLAAADAACAPAFSRERIEVHRSVLRSRRARRVWYTAGVLATVGAAVMLVLRPRPTPIPLDLSGASWTAPTDFLLDTPGSEFLRTVPLIVPHVETQTTTAAPRRGDTSGRKEP